MHQKDWSESWSESFTSLVINDSYLRVLWVLPAQEIQHRLHVRHLVWEKLHEDLVAPDLTEYQNVRDTLRERLINPFMHSVQPYTESI